MDQFLTEVYRGIQGQRLVKLQEISALNFANVVILR